MRRELALTISVALATAFIVAMSFREDGIRLVYPWALLGLLIVGALLWLRSQRVPRMRASLAFSRSAEARRAGQRSVWAQLESLPRALRTVALLLLGVAMARPQTFHPTDEIETDGIDLVLEAHKDRIPRQLGLLIDD